jgi:hypothetical protein
MACSSPLFELLHEHFANDYVILIFEDSTEYDCYTIRLCLHIPATVIMYLGVKLIYVSPTAALMYSYTENKPLTKTVKYYKKLSHHSPFNQSCFIQWERWAMARAPAAQAVLISYT